MNLHDLVTILARAPVPARGYHTEFVLAPDVYQEFMHYTQGRTRYLGIPVRSDHTVSFAETRVVADPRRKWWQVRK